MAAHPALSRAVNKAIASGAPVFRNWSPPAPFEFPQDHEPAPALTGPTTRYRLESAPMIHAPGIVAWAVNGYHFPKDRDTLRRVIVEGWPGIPDSAADALLSGRVPYRVTADHAVEFEA